MGPSIPSRALDGQWATLGCSLRRSSRFFAWGEATMLLSKQSSSSHSRGARRVGPKLVPLSLSASWGLAREPRPPWVAPGWRIDQPVCLVRASRHLRQGSGCWCCLRHSPADATAPFSLASSIFPSTRSSSLQKNYIVNINTRLFDSKFPSKRTGYFLVDINITCTGRPNLL